MIKAFIQREDENIDAEKRLGGECVHFDYLPWFFRDSFSINFVKQAFLEDYGVVVSVLKSSIPIKWSSASKEQFNGGMF